MRVSDRSESKGCPRKDGLKGGTSSGVVQNKHQPLNRICWSTERGISLPCTATAQSQVTKYLQN